MNAPDNQPFRLEDGILKVIPAGGQDELVKAAGLMVQVYESSRHIKSAASPLFSRADLENQAPPKGKFLSHMITMGSSELYGPNRNYDDWPHEELLRKHATFVTHARNYREHRNDDPKKAIGTIREERYCPELQRGEVLMWTDIDKAEEEFEKARRGEEQSGSMAARVKSDICTACGFESRKPSERCDCIALTPGRYFPEKKAYATMRNVDPTFKDYSWVRRPADRIAHYLNYMMPDHQKAASAGDRVLRGDELADMYGMTPRGPVEFLSEIAEYDAVSDDPVKAAFVKHVTPYVFRHHLSEPILAKMASMDTGKVMRELVDRSMVLPLPDFHSWVTGTSLRTSEIDPVVKEASSKMAAIRAIIIKRVRHEPSMAKLMNDSITEFNPALPGCGCSPGDAVTGFFDKVREKFSARFDVLSKSANANIRAGFTPRIEDTSPLSDEAFALGALYNAYLAKTASYLQHEPNALAALSGAR